jgi:molybdopterin-binding protein
LADEIISLRDGVMLATGPTNLFGGVVEQRQDGARVQMTPDVAIQVITERTGAVHIRIPPEDIIISRSPIESSARNSFSGAITAAVVEGDHIRLDLNIGITLSVVITKQSFADMRLTVDDTVYATFKTSAVKVY